MEEVKQQLGFDDALKILGIEDYSDRILLSNSHGELFHLMDYIGLANLINHYPELGIMFRPWFKGVVKSAEETWKRPESIFQHIGTVWNDHMQQSFKAFGEQERKQKEENNEQNR